MKKFGSGIKISRISKHCLEPNKTKPKMYGAFSIFSFAQQSIDGIYLELLLYLDL
jgi:hypothetical protein